VSTAFKLDVPVAISPHDHNVVYRPGRSTCTARATACQSWQVISPDLTLDDKSHQHESGGLTPDNVGVEYSRPSCSRSPSRRARGA